jgi:hypothetical protein
MFKYRLVIDQVMKPKDWVMLAVLIVFASGSLYLVWREFQEPIVFYEVSNIEENIWQTEETEQGTVVRNLEAGYEVVVADGFYFDQNTDDSGSLKIQDFKEPEEIYGGLPGCRVFIKQSSNEDIELVAKNQCSLDTECTGVNFNKKTFNNIEWEEIIFNGEFIGSGIPKYVYASPRKSYSVTFNCLDSYFINQIMSNIRFLESR